MPQLAEEIRADQVVVEAEERILGDGAFAEAKRGGDGIGASEIRLHRRRPADDVRRGEDCQRDRQRRPERTAPGQAVEREGRENRDGQRHDDRHAPEDAPVGHERVDEVRRHREVDSRQARVAPQETANPTTATSGATRRTVLGSDGRNSAATASAVPTRPTYDHVPRAT